ncbi:MAG: hypothetical protein K2X41_06170 [Hyphomicrobium sp.]|nr:hypothetical protein [Hyphomicrobium sp.]
MATAFLDLIFLFLWPLVLIAAAWGIAFNALAGKDEISEVVEALTRPSAIDDTAKLTEKSLRTFV